MSATDSFSFFNGFYTYVSSKVLRESYAWGSFISAGGYGRVYRATRLSTGQHIAIKALPSDVAVEELVVLQLMEQVLEAVAFLHDNRIAHRDIKPENIALAGGNANLIDFGFAEKQGGEGRELSTNFVWTGRYQSAGMKERLPHCPRAANVWACGAVLYELLSGETFMDTRRVLCPAYFGESSTTAVCGGVDIDNIAHMSSGTYALVAHMLGMDPSKRISAAIALASITGSIERLSNN